MKTATYKQMQNLLRDRSDHLMAVLEVSAANLMIPTDGRGLRILASVPKGEGKLGRQTNLCTLANGEEVAVEFEVSQDYREIEPQ